ncbi:hypothetical protein LAUMK7_01221 [Mycobacterium kansasii]|uniref:Uncharacterized protein n=1 Tax=Mycobacterium kansasii TaxID=1768 RepID=A0A653EGX4_MYCKA|nr:hypothetical protein MKANGN_41790 [Mycobacterium kansasii]VAZ58810.1 hypothetical protein LAUMK22_00602 [Mycobacterium kansasii]VAZ65205.1 hypothetical protein LAUMK40_01330 [Mycobacterium kansasii]VAZ72281.1 hypothetical protein LAUMK7_01221 [Mycobacterium kansasii]VTO95891.1 hypothetical protein BIN_B_00096 [Mycobacterium kansasii]
MAHDQLFSSTTEGEASGETEIFSATCFALD